MRHDAHDPIGRVIQGYVARENIGIAAESLLPERSTDERNLGPPGTIFIGAKPAAERRLDAKDREQVGIDACAIHLLRYARAHVEAGVPRGRYIHEAAIPLFPRAEISDRRSVFWEPYLRRIFEDLNQS